MKMRGRRVKLCKESICPCCNGKQELDRAYERREAERDIREWLEAAP